MKERRNSLIVFLFALAMLVSAGVRAATFTSSLPLEPAELVIPFGETFYVTLPEGLLDLPELPDNEYYGEVSREYHWSVEGGPSGDGLEATIPSSAAGGSGMISSPGSYAVEFTGKAIYTVRWMENGVEHSSEPQEAALTSSQGGRLRLPFILVDISLDLNTQPLVRLNSDDDDFNDIQDRDDMNPQDHEIRAMFQMNLKTPQVSEGTLTLNAYAPSSQIRIWISDGSGGRQAIGSGQTWSVADFNALADKTLYIEGINCSNYENDVILSFFYQGGGCYVEDHKSKKCDFPICNFSDRM